MNSTVMSLTFQDRTNRIVIAVAVSGTLFGLTTGLGAEAPSQLRYLSPAELTATIDESELLYEIRFREDLESLAPDGLTEAAWPSFGSGLEHPFVEVTPDGRSLVPYQLGDGCVAQMTAAEPAFARRDYESAAKVYAAAVASFPDCYLAYLHLGDTSWHRGDTEAALLRYQRAADLNPYSFQAHYFHANALLKLGRTSEAYNGYLDALALRPHRESIEQLFAHYGGKIGATYDPWRLAPRVLLEPMKDGMTITIDPTDSAAPAWKTYGQCRALWTIEPDFGPSSDGKEESVWNNTTEINCLRAAVAAYRNGMAAGVVSEDRDLERLHQVDEAGLLVGLVFYEVGGHINPDILLLLPQEIRDTILAYLERFVLVRQSGSDR